ncbi:Alpha/Beta hydrolase protein [Aspergillus undulatus]|uniref:Alpha/Beta hydrolase protein n=1 Tax=Aspergillus undulatus TaxID=1810928 RepID=UPI003CCD4150
MAGNKDLHELRPASIVQPLHNSIPTELVPRFDPVYVQYYNKYNAGRLHTHEVSIEAFRKDPAKYLTSYGRAAGPDIFRITEQTCAVKDGEIKVRIFEPASILDEQGKPKKRAVYVNFHGGGWVFGNLATDHDLFPTAVDDCWAAFNWVRSRADEFHLDVNRISALVVPVCDLHSPFTPDGQFDREGCPYESYREMEYTIALPVARMSYFHKHFLGVPRPALSDEDWKISPMLASSFSNLAPALVFSAEMDPLRDEAEVYADKLKVAGGRVELVGVPGAPHTFSGLDDILESAKMFNAKVIDTMKKELLS